MTQENKSRLIKLCVTLHRTNGLLRFYLTLPFSSVCLIASKGDFSSSASISNYISCKVNMITSYFQTFLAKSGDFVVNLRKK